MLNFHATQTKKIKRCYQLFEYFTDRSFSGCMVLANIPLLLPPSQPPRVKKRATHHQDGHQGALQEPTQHVAPVMLVVRHPGESRVHRGGDQEKLEGWPQQPRPFHLQPGLQVELGGDGAAVRVFLQRTQ